MGGRCRPFPGGSRLVDGSSSVPLARWHQCPVPVDHDHPWPAAVTATLPLLRLGDRENSARAATSSRARGLTNRERLAYTGWSWKGIEATSRRKWKQGQVRPSGSNRCRGPWRRRRRRSNRVMAAELDGCLVHKVPSSWGALLKAGHTACEL